jgi:membrane associated rhomboid family serine protease
MGIYDRDYYRREGPSFLGYLTERGTVCKWLIGVNVVAFIIQLATRAATPEGDPLHGWFTDLFILNRVEVLGGQIWRLLTYAFLHSTDRPLHILFNMLFLWWFGRDVEDLYGQREFLLFYLVSAVLGGIAFTVVPLGAQLCLGASGAVTAVMVVFACHYPTRLVYVFFLLPVPVWLLVLFEVCMDAFSFLANLHDPTALTTAVQVHLAGAAFGFLYHRYNWRLNGLLPNLGRWWRRRGAPRLRVYRPDEEERAAAAVHAGRPAGWDEEQLEAKMDAVLEKISRTGKESLTESEKQLLIRASEVFRRRRT